MDWSDLHMSWLDELESDPAYGAVITPLLLETLCPKPSHRYLDLGSGDGRISRAVAEMDATVHGVELNRHLAALSEQPTVIARLPDLSFLGSDSYDGAYCVLAIEHIEDHGELFRQISNVVRPTGVLCVVMNHPVWTAPGSSPITDSDGEVLWRPGRYFTRGTSTEPIGSSSVVFHHRSMADLLNAAAEARWSLERIIERPHHSLEDQAGIPRLLACRWRLLP